MSPNFLIATALLTAACSYGAIAANNRVWRGVFVIGAVLVTWYTWAIAPL